LRECLQVSAQKLPPCCRRTAYALESKAQIKAAFSPRPKIHVLGRAQNSGCKRPSTLTNMEYRALRDAELDAERIEAASQGWERII
jgi:hypothetical protein